MRSPQRLLSYTLAAALLAGGVWYLVRYRAKETAAQAPRRWTSLNDPEPHAPACAFWAPWQRLVAPGQPQDYLAQLKRRLAEASTRSGEYQALIRRSTGVLAGTTESVCIAGRFTPEGPYHLDGSDARSCETLPRAFLDSNLELSVERLETNDFVNELRFTVGVEDVRPANFWPFLHEQASLILGGYRGWSKAFPAYFESARRGLALVGPEPLASGDMRLRYAWQTQTMRQAMPKWADYLMLLSDLVSMRTKVVGVDGQVLLDSQVETVLTGIALTVPPRTLDYLAAPHEIPLTVAHDFQVRFRGLDIELKGMRFGGVLRPAASGIVYEGKFLGVTDVAVGGAYRGLVGGSFGKMIHELVREHLDAELERLTTGNRGQGWTFRLGLETIDQVNVLTYATSFQSPVNFLNLLREDKDRGDSHALPNAKALAELNAWASASVDALLADAASACQR